MICSIVNQYFLDLERRIEDLVNTPGFFKDIPRRALVEKRLGGHTSDELARLFDVGL